MDLTRMEQPKKDVKTPKKESFTSKLANGSRPASPVEVFMHWNFVNSLCVFWDLCTPLQFVCCSHVLQ